MKPITKGQVSSKLTSDSSHLSALDLHRQTGREAFRFDPGNKGRIHSAGEEQLTQLTCNLVSRVQQLQAMRNKSCQKKKNFFFLWMMCEL